MKKHFFVFFVLLFTPLLFAPVSPTFVPGFSTIGLQAEAAKVQASFSAMEGLLKANPFGEANAPGLSQVLLNKAAELKANLQELGTKLDQKMDALTDEQRQNAVYAYAAFLIALADLKKIADNRFLFDVSYQLGETYQVCGINQFVWGDKYNIRIPDLPAL